MSNKEEQKTKYFKAKKALLSSLSIFTLLLSILLSVNIDNNKANALDWDPAKWLMCSLGESGRDYLKATRTDWIPFLLSSKSAIGQVDNPNYNIHNKILSVSGYKFNQSDLEIAKNPFDKFGLMGLTFTSYRGEWKYFNVDPCASGDRQESQMTNFGQFYADRKEPLSAYYEVSSSQDIRTKEFAKGTWTAFMKSFTDRLSNAIMFASKTIVTFLLALLSLSFKDVSTFIGIGETFQTDIFTKLYNGLFLPLSTFMFLLTAGYIFYNGLVKRQYREVFVNGIAKTLVCFILAVFIAYNPNFISLPNKIATIGQALVVSGMANNVEGDGNDLCETQVGISDIGDVLNPTALDTVGDGMKSVLACRIWSEFLFKPFIKGQFGTEYNDLEVVNNENKDWVGEPVVALGTRDIKNWGLFHISVMSGKHSPVDGIDSPLIGGMHKDYYRIVDALSNYEEEYYQVDTESGDVGDASDEQLQYESGYPEVKQTTPTQYWVYWNGSRQGERIAQSVIILLMTILGSILPLVFAFMSTMYGIGITILMLFSPIFLTLGCWGGKGNQIFTQWFGTLLVTILKKIFATLLLIISIVIVTTTFNLLNDVGIFHTVVALFIVITTMYKSRYMLINQLASINIGQLNTSSFTNAINKFKSSAKFGAEMGASGAIGAYTANKYGGNAYKGAGSAMLQTLKNKAYTSETGRRAMTVYSTTVKGEAGKNENEGRYCVSCGVKIEENSIAYMDENNNYWCEYCASAESYVGMTEVYVDNIDDNAMEVTKESEVNVTRVKNENIDGNIDFDTEKLSHLTYDELLKDFDWTNESAENWSVNNNREKVAERVIDSITIVKNDMNNILEQDGKLKDFYIPEPIRSYVDSNALRKTVKANDIEAYSNIIETGWLNWYRQVAVKRDDTDEEIEYAINRIKDNINNLNIVLSSNIVNNNVNNDEE